jgi:hypothetical protein
LTNGSSFGTLVEIKRDQMLDFARKPNQSGTKLPIHKPDQKLETKPEEKIKPKAADLFDGVALSLLPSRESSD